ncbi:acridine efflux pump constituent [Bordetella holmesii]|uniref:Multidrug resistance protein MdtE domain protein n=2 Tax=Bordetella holmesii TaxID=35814 RepID=A0A158M426_9BORD|nr:multidrug efflux periplasmic linker BpeA domain protein [Bordetella holmesii ATCC 51541]AIT27593.1 multidrug efflux periplasmic linker BpeA domain protein [Bordetella holmesii 44057]AMD46405.1 acridine efflux pump constituent [Bordetella holmesii H558]AOB35299.1 acridine efflux pump constituent [Bordetella holmesii]EWM40367.1 multidrug efflux periplasmic linker BpeA domain protein [Bordetella holmesii 35009]EWM43478.1 multidrug efflux periplasmic linker BpeA domain protein [Bordetella holme
MVVKDGKVQQVAVSTSSSLNNQWIISSGLSAGDVVVVEGFQKIRPGAPVQTSPWNPNGKAAGAAGQPGATPADGQAPAKKEPNS